VSVKIFISCVSDEFRAYRDQLRTDLTALNVEVKVQEDFKDPGRTTLENDDLYIRGCDAVVHLVGDMTGWAAKPASAKAILTKYPDITDRFPPLHELLDRGEEISYTQWEAWLALYHDKPLLIAQAADGAEGRGPNFGPTAESRAAQRAHLDRMRAVEHHQGCTFLNADQLAKYVLSSPILGPRKEQAGWLPYIGLLPGLLVLLVTPWVADQWAKTLGVPVAAPLALVLVVAGLALPLVYARYLIMLGASDALAGSRDRPGYDALRENLATGGLATHLYARWLTGFLDRIDRFFGDADKKDQTLFPHAFGLKTPAPLWTAPSFDRCLLLALLYPVATVIIMWSLSGHVGPAEAALALPHASSGWRGGFVAALGFSAFGIWRRSVHPPRWIRFFWFVVVFGFAGVGAGIDAVTVSIAVAIVGAFIFVGTGVGVIAFALTYPLADMIAVSAILVFVLVPILHVIAENNAYNAVAFVVIACSYVIAFFVAGVVAGAVAWLSDTAIRYGKQGAFLLLFFAAMTSGCLAAAHSLSTSLWIGATPAPVLLFLGLLTLLNAPFDWASLGLTRALLRRGLELKGWWPFFLALADAVAATVIIALLALSMVIGVQTFDALAMHGGGKAVLPLGLLFDGIAAHPDAPEYWWVYALLLSTMIPSLINLAIGGTALMRAVPGLPSLLLHFMPATGGVPTYDRAWIAAVLTLQAALGAILGVAVQVLVAWGLLFHVMPAVGLGLLDLARGLAALDLPAQLIEFVAGAV
jgi:hypothetical protein